MAALPQLVETSPETLTHALAPLAARMRVSRWVRYASRGALAGIGVSLVGVILAHLDLLPDAIPLEALIPGAIVAGVVAGTVPALLKPVTPMDAARLTETRLGLKERLSSALEFEREAPQNGRATVLLRLQHGDALGHARGIAPRDAVPFRFVWELKALLAGAAVLALALILPNLPIFIPPQLRMERSIVHKEGDKLVVRARTIEKFADAHRLTQTKRAAQDMRRLGEQMSHSRLDKKQALLKYSQLTQQMQALQKKLSDAAAGGQANKSLSQAGQQLAQSLQAAGSGGKSGNNPSTGNPASSNKTGSAGQPGSAGKAGDKPGQKPGDHGFNIPGFNKNHPQGAPGTPEAGGKPNATEEVRKAAEAMRRGDVSGLSDQLRKLADKTQSGALSPEQQQQAQQDLQKLSDALKGTPMKETQQHAQAAADALKRGDKQQAASEMRKAADAAEREQQQQMDSQGMNKAQQSLQKSQEEMAGASSPGDIGSSTDDAGQDGQGSGSGDSSGNGDSQGEQSADQRMHSGDGDGKGQGNQPGDEPGEEGGGAGAANRAGHGGNHGGGKIPKQKFEKFKGPAPHMLNPNFDPSRSPRYAKVYLGKPGQGKEAGRLGKAVKMRPGAAPPGGAQSSVPYYNYVGDAKKAAEKSVDNENIPPAYRDQVRKYFNSITPDGK